MTKPILSAVVGTNAELIAEVARLYLKPGMSVIDLTYGRGVFWKTADLWGIELTKCDIAPQFQDVHRQDFTNLSGTLYDDDTYDVAVFDPPYMHGQGAKGAKSTIKASIADCYKNNDADQAPMNHTRIMADYYEPGMREAARVVKPGGQVWVKCKDEIEAGKQRWSHREVYEIAEKLGLKAKDLFMLVQTTTPAMRQEVQHHARKNHSILWVFEK